MYLININCEVFYPLYPDHTFNINCLRILAGDYIVKVNDVHART